MTKKVLKTPRDFFTLAGIELNKAMEQRLKVAREGRTRAWELEQYDNIKDSFTKEANKIVSSMMEAATAERDKLVMEARVLRNRPSSPLKPKDGNLMVYHQNRITNMLNGLSEEDAIKEFSNMARMLNDDERPYLHIYEDALLAKVKDPVYKHVAEDEMFKYKSVDEKRAYVKAACAEAEVKELETLAALIKDDLEKVATGDKLPLYSYHDVFEEIAGGSKTEENLLKINPYAGNTNPDSGESE